jgi:hypothetical protein
MPSGGEFVKQNDHHRREHDLLLAGVDGLGRRRVSGIKRVFVTASTRAEALILGVAGADAMMPDCGHGGGFGGDMEGDYLEWGKL